MKKNVLTPPTSPTSIIRIAPVCNGKIYVTPHPTDKEASASWDLPIEEQVEHFSPKSEKSIRKVKERYNAHLHTSALEPRERDQFSPRPIHCSRRNSCTTEAMQRQPGKGKRAVGHGRRALEGIPSVIGFPSAGSASCCSIL